jgi:hypothetical protein
LFSCPRGRSPDRLTAVLTAPIVKAAANPQIIPIRTPESKPPVHLSTPRLTSKVTTTNTIVDKSTEPIVLAIILVSSAFLQPKMSTMNMT